MSQNLRILGLNCLVCLALVVSGCSAFYHYYPVTVQTIDAETKKPISGARAEITYPLASPYKAPYVSSGETREDGIAELKAATKDQHLALMEVSAPGYMKDHEDLPFDEIEKQSDHPADAGKKPTFVRELYAEPHPVVDLVFPDGSIGVLKLKVEIREDYVYLTGQRAFQYPVEISDHVTITGPPVLTRAAPAGFTARYANGTILNSRAVDPDVGFWWIGRDEEKEVYFIGSPLACQQYRKKHPQLITGDDQKSSGRKGRRKRDS